MLTFAIKQKLNQLNLQEKTFTRIPWTDFL